jgi:mannose-6-phosphate isomerase-like protein (cupin superfamily)
MAVAFATPPTGEISYKDYARAQTMDNAAVPIMGGTGLATGSYSVAPGGETGWRAVPGAMVLAVTKGKLTLHGGEGCTAKDYGVGQAGVVPAGTYRVDNAGQEPLEFFGLFFEQAAGAPKPLAEGPTETAPANCSGVSGLAAGASPSGVAVTTPAAGTLIDSLYGHHASLDIKAGKDLFATYYDFGPGASSGWISHRPAVNIVQSGELAYYEARDGKCVKTETFYPGQAFYHPAHRHMAVSEGKEHLLLTTVYFDLPHETPLPAVGNQITAVDFTQAPPADCSTRLR